VDGGLTTQLQDDFAAKVLDHDRESRHAKL
jgi:hypothetical protein